MSPATSRDFVMDEHPVNVPTIAIANNSNVYFISQPLDLYKQSSGQPSVDRNLRHHGTSAGARYAARGNGHQQRIAADVESRDTQVQLINSDQARRKAGEVDDDRGLHPARIAEVNGSRRRDR